MQRSGDFQHIAPNMQALIADNHYNHSDDYFAVFRFIGTEGVITGTLGAMYNYPHGRPDTLEWSSRRHYPDKRFEAKLEGKWIPDSFIGPTASLMQAIQEDGVPETDGHDNLQTLRVVEACYLSAAEHRTVNLGECEAIPCQGLETGSLETERWIMRSCTEISESADERFCEIMLMAISCSGILLSAHSRSEADGTTSRGQGRDRHRRRPGDRQGDRAAAGARGRARRDRRIQRRERGRGRGGDRGGWRPGLAYPVDISDVAAVQRMVDDVAAQLGHIDILVNNAGVVQTKPMLDLTEADWDRVLDVNLRGTFFSSRPSPGR